MKRLVLKRRWYDEHRTIGELTADGGFHAFTLEPGREDTDAPRAPVGFYLLERHGWDADSPVKYRRTWALVGKDVSHQEEGGIPRSAILIHTGNFDEQTRGCILIGESIAWMAKEPAVSDSRTAMDRLRNFIGEADAFLTIEG